jgi:hypothetical protein
MFLFSVYTLVLRSWSHNEPQFLGGPRGEAVTRYVSYGSDSELDVVQYVPLITVIVTVACRLKRNETEPENCKNKIAKSSQFD